MNNGTTWMKEQHDLLRGGCGDQTKFSNNYMIERHWKGVARPSEATRYIHHLRLDTFPSVAKIKGFIRSTILYRPVEKGTEFLIITVWESLDSIRQFAGANVEQAVVPAVVQEMMVEWEERVAHYEVVPA
jgi:heme-degrading monooxygenase HmoA